MRGRGKNHYFLNREEPDSPKQCFAVSGEISGVGGAKSEERFANRRKLKMERGEKNKHNFVFFGLVFLYGADCCQEGKEGSGDSFLNIGSTFTKVPVLGQSRRKWGIHSLGNVRNQQGKN